MKKIKAVAFIMLFLFLFITVSVVAEISMTDVNCRWLTEFYNEPDNSLDAVYIGSSNCYTFWEPNYAWKNYGITVYPYSSPSQPLTVTEYMIKEAVKKQPNAVFIVNTNSIDKDIDDVICHRLLDNMPVSKNKKNLSNYLLKSADISFSQRMQFYLPLISYHEFWRNPNGEAFSSRSDELKGRNLYYWSFNKTTDISEVYLKTEKCGSVSDEISESIESLLDYCDSENIKILFVTVPRAERTIETVEKINTINKMITDRGYPIVDLSDDPKKAYINPVTDYFNDRHTNIHGALKFTDYLSKYLVEKYEFTDKRQDAAYESWNKSYKAFLKMFSPYITDFELDFEHRDFYLPTPKESKAYIKSGKAFISWKTVENAEGYSVYRSEEKGNWQFIADTTDSDYCDKSIKPDKEYSYIVVAYRFENKEKIYGNYKYNGVAASVE